MWVYKELINRLQREREELIKETKDKLKKAGDIFKEKFEESFNLIGDLPSWKNRTKEIVNNFIEEEDKVKFAFQMIDTEKEENLISKGEKFKKDIDNLITRTDESISDFLGDFVAEVRNEYTGNFIRLRGDDPTLSRILGEIKPARISQEENKKNQLKKQASFVSIDNSKGNSFLQNNTKRFNSHINIDNPSMRSRKQTKYTTVTDIRKTGGVSKETSPNHSFRKIQSTNREVLTHNRITAGDYGFTRRNKRVPGEFGTVSQFNVDSSRSPQQRFGTQTRQYKLQKSQTFAKRGLVGKFDAVSSERRINGGGSKKIKSKAMQDLLTGKHRRTIQQLLDNKLKDLDLSFGG